MAWAVVSSTGGAWPTVGPINTTGATLIIAVTSQPVTAQTSFSDSMGNVWQSLVFTQSAGNVASQLLYCYQPRTSASHTFTTGSTSSIGVVAFSGSVGKGPVDKSAVNASASGTALNAGSITSTANGDLVVSSLAQSGSDFTGLAISSGTIVVNYPKDGFGNPGHAIAWQAQVSAGAIDPSWTWTNNSNGDVAFNAAFKATLPLSTGTKTFLMGATMFGVMQPVMFGAMLGGEGGGGSSARPTVFLTGGGANLTGGGQNLTGGDD